MRFFSGWDPEERGFEMHCFSTFSFAVGAVALLVGAVNAKGQSCVPAPLDLVSWWPGDGTADDIQDGNNGMLQNGATFAPAMVGQGFSFDGIDDHVSISDDVSIRGIGAFTIDFWAKFNVVPRTGNGADTMTLLEKAGDYLILWRAEQGHITLDLNDGCDGGINGPYHLGFNFFYPALQPGEFHHYAFVGVDGGAAGPEFHFYLDGVEQVIVAQNDPPHVGCGWFAGVTGDLAFGIRSQPVSPVPNAFDGVIDEVEFFDRVLASDEIAAIYNAGSAGKCKDQDADGVVDDLDLCSDTTVPEGVPTVRLGVNRWALVDGDGIFDTTPAPGGGGGPELGFTIEGTAGCSCEQIIAALGLGAGHRKFGCSNSAMEAWVALVNP